jgi:hypothetical protein
MHRYVFFPHLFRFSYQSILSKSVTKTKRKRKPKYLKLKTKYKANLIGIGTSN